MNVFDVVNDGDGSQKNKSKINSTKLRIYHLAQAPSNVTLSYVFR